MSSIIEYYCQRCLAANSLGQEFCGRCGTRLMLIVEPPAARFETVRTGGAYEEHMLERVSCLESKIGQLAERLEQTLDLLLRQARNSYLDHALIETLVSALSKDQIIDRKKLNSLWQLRCQHDSDEGSEDSRLEGLRAKINKGFRSGDCTRFQRCVDEAIVLLRKRQEPRAIRSLQRAALVAPDNAALLAYLGEYFFRSEKMSTAYDYLSRALQSAPEEHGVCLMLGIVSADEGETDRAKSLLIEAASHHKPSFAAHYGLGRLLAAEQKWDKALREFKSALLARPSPEAHYVLGSTYYQLGRYRMAKKHLCRAIEIDGEYAEAHYTLGLVFLKTQHMGEANAAFRKAHGNGGIVPGKDQPGRPRRTRRTTPTNSPLFDSSGDPTRKGLMTADRRLAQALREDTLRTAVEESN